MDPKTNEMISNVVKQYLSKNKVKIVIGTPCFESICLTAKQGCRHYNG